MPEQSQPRTIRKEDLEALRTRHDWWSANALTEDAWPLLRAILRAFTSIEDRKRFLPKGKVEKANNYETRLQMSRYLGVLEEVVDGFVGGVLAEAPEIAIKTRSGNANLLEEWTRNVDGQGTALAAYVEGQAPEAAAIGGSVTLLLRPEARKDLLAADQLTAADIKTEALHRKYGTLFPRAVQIPVEQLTHWGHDEAGRPTWVIFERVLTRQPTPFAVPQRLVQWMVIDRETIRVFEGELEQNRQKVKWTGEKGPDGKPLVKVDELAIKGDAIEVTPPGGIVHGLGIVPVAYYYGSERGTFCGKSIFAGTARADAQGFHTESVSGFAEYVANVPLLVLKLKGGRRVGEIFRESTQAIKLDAEAKEEISYASLPTESFDHSEKRVERYRLDAYRQAGADPSGLFDGGATPESGRKARLRAENTEGRKLKNFAKNTSQFATDMLEIAARYLAAAPVSIDEKAFTGDVRYADTFDLESVDDLIGHYIEVRPFINSPTWDVGMRKRIALKLRGSVGKEQAQKILDEIENLPVDASTEPPPPKVSAPARPPADPAHPTAKKSP